MPALLFSFEGEARQHRPRIPRKVPGILNDQKPEKVRYALHSDDGERAVDSEVTFTLTPTPAGGTRVRLVHDGFIVRESDLVAMRRAA